MSAPKGVTARDPQTIQATLYRLTKRSEPFGLGTGDRVYTLGNDSAITGAATVAELRAEVARLNRVVRALTEVLQSKGIVS